MPESWTNLLSDWNIRGGWKLCLWKMMVMVWPVGGEGFEKRVIVQQKLCKQGCRGGVESEDKYQERMDIA